MSKSKPHPVIGCHNGEIMEFPGVREAADYIGCAVSTVYLVLRTGQEYNGWVLDYKLSQRQIDMLINESKK